MDTLLLHRPSPALTTVTPKLSHKRPCCSAASDLKKPSFTTTTTPNGFNPDVLLESFLGLSDTSLDFSFDRIMNSKNSDTEQNDMINSALRLGSALVEAGKRSSRARASMHNAVVWALSPDLTIKVFSLLDTQSVCYAAAACSFFKNCAADPACYANIDLITVVPRVNNAVVATMVHRAGKGLHNVELSLTLESVRTYCPLIERLFFESSKTGRDDSLKLPTCSDLVNNCPHLSSLALRGFKLHDQKARILVKGFRKLRYIDFSACYSITGAFLKNLGGNAGGGLLEVLILRDCVQLKEVEVTRLLSAVLAGDFKHLKYLDISNREGLVSEGDRYRRCCSSSFNEVDSSYNSDVNSEINSTSNSSSLASGSSSFVSTSESSFSSDPGSGSEDSSFMAGESSEEVDNVSV